MVCPPARALASGLSPLLVDYHGITIIQCRPCQVADKVLSAVSLAHLLKLVEGTLELGNLTLAIHLIIDCI